MPELAKVPRRTDFPASSSSAGELVSIGATVQPRLFGPLALEADAEALRWRTRLAAWLPRGARG